MCFLLLNSSKIFLTLYVETKKEELENLFVKHYMDSELLDCI